MLFRYTPYVWLVVLSAAAAAGMLMFVWPRRDSPGARVYLVLLATAAFWSGANGLEMLGADIPTKVFWRDVQSIPFAVGPVLWLVFVLEYTGRHRWLNGRMLVFAIEPALAIALNLSNTSHGLFRHSFSLDLSGPFPALDWQPGPFFAPHLVYSLAVIAMTVSILLVELRRAAWPYRGQLAVLLAACAGPVLPLALFNLGFKPQPHDFSPALSSLAIALTAWAAYYYRFLDLTPVAGARVLESMSDGVIVLDGQRRVVGLNPAARRILGLSLKETIGSPARRVFSGLPDLAALCEAPAPGWARTPVALDGASAAFPSLYEAHSSALPTTAGRPLGSLVTLHDVSERMAQQSRSVEQQRAVAVLEERERLARELHDSLGQVLGFVYLQSETARALLVNGDTARLDASLAGLARAAQEAQRDVREYILSTKAPLLEDGFFPALREYLAQFGELYGMCVELILAGGRPEPLFAPRVEVQLLRIIQEALSNVRKHARAFSVEITFETHDGAAWVTVEDDGCGFEPAAVGGGQGYGLASMRARAEEAGGRLSIISAPDQGTRVIVEVPLAGGAP